MADFPATYDGQRFETNTGGSNSGGTVLASSGANTETTYTQVIASTSFDAAGFWTFIHAETNTTLRQHLVDIGIGAAASETTLIEDILYTHRNDGVGSWLYWPIAIPAGTRIAARTRCTTTAISVRLSILLCANGFMASAPQGRVFTWGADTSDSGGTQIDSGGAANTKPATYTTLSASTDADVQGLVICMGANIGDVSTASNVQHRVDIASGAASSETIIIPDLAFQQLTSGDMIMPQGIGFLPIRIPAGTRLSARHQCSSTDAVDRAPDIVLYGVA